MAETRMSLPEDSRPDDLHHRLDSVERQAHEQRQRIRTQAKNATYRALVSLVAALAKGTDGPREALQIIRDELDTIQRDVEKAEKKAARRAAKGDTSLEDAGK